MILVALLLGSAVPDNARAADKAKAQPAEKAQRLAPALPVSLEQALYLIRSTLLTLNDANRSGNYTVLHDLAAPDFQANNTAADLGQNFADLRHRNFDLYGVALLAPQFTESPSLDQNGLLRLAGYFATQPRQISFDLAYQNVSGEWRLFAIAIATPESAPASAALQADQSQAKQSQ